MRKVSQMATDSFKKYLKFRQTFTFQELETKYPPKFIHSHKKLIYSSLPRLSPEVMNEKVQVTKWDCIDFPVEIPKNEIKQNMFQDAFPYTPSSSGNTDWYVNFADARLFGFYEGGLFAQDEMQVMEHPCLGSIRNAMSKIAETDKNALPYTRATYQSQMYSTPVLIKGAKRRVFVATDANEEAGRPYGLYGRAFASANTDSITRALTFFNPPTTTNLIAMEAPKGGNKKYKREEIGDAFGTAFTGFLCAKIETKESSPNDRVVIHTGNWGTGAFGGNRVLMACIQLLASKIAEVDELVFHTFEPTATDAYKQGKLLYEELLEKNMNVQDVLESLYQKGFMWGFSDGN